MNWISNYSQIFKRESKEIISSSFIGSVIIMPFVIMVLEWYLFSNNSISLYKFVVSLLKLNKCLKNNKFFGYNEVLIMLHYLFLHKAKEVKRKYYRI